MSAETGLLGGLLYLSLFICAAIYILKTFFPKADTGRRIPAAFMAMALGSYFMDASLNFPMERPVMQFFLSFLLALSLNVFLSGKDSKATNGLELSRPASPKLVSRRR